MASEMEIIEVLEDSIISRIQRHISLLGYPCTKTYMDRAVFPFFYNKRMDTCIEQRAFTQTAFAIQYGQRLAQNKFD